MIDHRSHANQEKIQALTGFKHITLQYQRSTLATKAIKPPKRGSFCKYMYI